MNLDFQGSNIHQFKFTNLLNYNKSWKYIIQSSPRRLSEISQVTSGYRQIRYQHFLFHPLYLCCLFRFQYRCLTFCQTFSFFRCYILWKLLCSVLNIITFNNSNFSTHIRKFAHLNEHSNPVQFVWVLIYTHAYIYIHTYIHISVCVRACVRDWILENRLNCITWPIPFIGPVDNYTQILPVHCCTDRPS